MCRVLIAGGGAAGMFAAAAAADRGHQVELFEKMTGWEENCLLQERAGAI